MIQMNLIRSQYSDEGENYNREVQDAEEYKEEKEKNMNLKQI